MLMVPFSNLVIDPYDVFGISPIGAGATTNQRYQHVRRLLDPAQPIDVLLLGDSVMGINDPRMLVDVFPGQSVYNASFFMATAVDIARMLDATLGRSSRPPSLIVVGLDPLLFVDKGETPSAQMRMPPPVTGEPTLAFYRSMLLASSAFHSTHKLAEKLKDTPSLIFDRQFGHYQLPEQNALIARDHAAFVSRKFASTRLEPSLPPFDERQFAALVTIEQTARKHGSSVLWVIQPTSVFLRNAIGEEQHRQFLASIRSHVRGSLVDLSDRTEFTDDAMRWYDAKHYLPATGRDLLMVAATRASLPTSLNH